MTLVEYKGELDEEQYKKFVEFLAYIKKDKESKPNTGTTCLHCKGKGTVHYKHTDYECPVCHGEGKVF